MTFMEAVEAMEAGEWVNRLDKINHCPIAKINEVWRYFNGDNYKASAEDVKATDWFVDRFVVEPEGGNR